MPTINELLTASRAAHVDYRRNMPRMQNVRGKVQEMPGDTVKARQALELAGTLRKQAHDADPDKTDPAWAADQAIVGDHDAVLTFYAEVLGRIPAGE